MYERRFFTNDLYALHYLFELIDLDKITTPVPKLHIFLYHRGSKRASTPALFIWGSKYGTKMVRHTVERMTSVEQKTLLDNWYRQFNDQLVNFLYRGVRIRAEAQDLAQEIYLRMLRVKNPELIAAPRAYLYRVAIHVLDEWRTKERKAKLHSSDTFEDMLVTDEATDSHKRDLTVDLKNALEKLAPIYSATLILHWHHGMSYSEIAKRLDVSERQVKRYIVKGYATLRVRLEPGLDSTHD